MTLEEAIQHWKEEAKANRNGALECARVNNWDAAIAWKACAQEHDQLAEWLTELKQRKENHSNWIDRDGVYVCASCGGENGVMTTFCPDCGAEMG